MATRRDYSGRLDWTRCNAVGGLFILGLQSRTSHRAAPNPTNAVGGLFILSLQKHYVSAPLPIPPTQRLCEKFVVRPSGGSLYLYLRRITNFRLKAGLRTLHFHTVSQLVGLSAAVVIGLIDDSTLLGDLAYEEVAHR